VSVKVNIVANYLGRGWAALLSLVFVPLYIRFLGVESYGLIGIYASLLGLFAVMDLGLSTTLNRILAQHESQGMEAAQLRNLVRTFEVSYWGIGMVVGAIVLAVAPWLATHWINDKNLPPGATTEALRLMGGVIVFQWPVSLYMGGLMGLQRQALLNIIRSAVATAQGVGAVLVLWLVSPTIQAFFVWQVAVGALQILLLRRYLLRSLPGDGMRGGFELKWLLHNWKFSAGTLGITLLATVLTQLDKVILSKWLPLTAFGYYTLATTVGAAVTSLGAPIYAAVFPRLSQLHANGDEPGLARLYHKTSRLMSLLMIPIGLVLGLFALPILTLWLHDAGIAEKVAPILRVMIVGTVANAVMMVPLALQLAYGWTRLSIYKNIIAVLLFVPMLLGLVAHYGALGAAISWAVLNLGYVAFEPVMMHRRLLRSEMRAWYLHDVGSVALIAGAVGLAIWWLIHGLLHLG